jgi:hypothetical protein
MWRPNLCAALEPSDSWRRRHIISSDTYARCVAPGSPLSRTQTLLGIGDGILRTKPLPSGIQQMHAPGVSVAMRLRSQQIAIRRVGIDASQHGLSTMEDLIVQAHPNAGQVLLTVDDASLMRGRLKHIVDGADADGHTQQITQELANAAIGAVADLRQPNNHLAQPSLGDRQLEQNRIVQRGRCERVIQRRTRLMGLLVTNLRPSPCRTARSLTVADLANANPSSRIRPQNCDFRSGLG